MEGKPLEIKQILQFFETWAPGKLAEDYDNVGLLVGQSSGKVNRILVSLDTTEEVVEEAIAKKCELIVSHHPILFKGIKRLNGQNYVARTIEKAIRNEIGLLAVHTNLDNVNTGVNKQLADKLGLSNTTILRPVRQQLQKLTFYVPLDQKEQVLKAVHSVGAGNIGNYSECSFASEGTGSFTPGSGANPTLGTVLQKESVTEARIEVVVPRHLSEKVIKKLKEVHPYEEVAYFLENTENAWQETGAGMVGDLKEPILWQKFIEMVKSVLNIPFLKHTKSIKDTVQRIAVCGGSGFFLLPDAKGAKADVFLTSDIKYHEFFDAENQLVLMDVGHFESEQYTSQMIKENLSIQFPNIAVLLSETKTNPVFYA